MAAILRLPQSAVIIISVISIQTRRQLMIEERSLIEGFLVSYTVTKNSTTLADLTLALKESVHPLEIELIGSGYTTALLGIPQVRYYYLPTIQPTFAPSIDAAKQPPSPFVIIIIITSTILITIAVIMASFADRIYVSNWNDRFLGGGFCKRSFACIERSSNCITEVYLSVVKCCVSPVSGPITYRTALRPRAVGSRSRTPRDQYDRYFNR